MHMCDKRRYIYEKVRCLEFLALHIHHQPTKCTYAVSKSTYNDSITPAAFMRELMKRGFDGYYKVDSEVAYAILKEICVNVYGVTP